MDLKKLDISVVVLAREHNPSILHPSFLFSKGIVPEEWEVAEPPLCTPPLAIVKFKNGITFSVESSKFQVIQSPPPQELDDSIVPKLAINYIESLPYVPYTAVGINITVALSHKKPEKYLIDRFLIQENCNVSGLNLEAAILHFIYPINNGVLNLHCEPGEVKEDDPSSRNPVVLVKANYHVSCIGDEVVSEVKEAISAFSIRCKHFEDSVITEVFKME
jgi:hypothetical protein